VTKEGRGRLLSPSSHGEWKEGGGGQAGRCAFCLMVSVSPVPVCRGLSVFCTCISSHSSAYMFLTSLSFSSLSSLLGEMTASCDVMSCHVVCSWLCCRERGVFSVYITDRAERPVLAMEKAMDCIPTPCSSLPCVPTYLLFWICNVTLSVYMHICAICLFFTFCTWPPMPIYCLSLSPQLVSFTPSVSS